MIEIKKNKIIAIIPARGGSKGIPNKNIIDFCGKPLIAWSIVQAKNSKYIKNIYVSSDDKKISFFSKKFGANIIKRPKRLARDTSSTEEALLHVLEYLENIDDEEIDIVVLLQATSPIRDSDDIDKAIELFIKKGADSLFSATKLEDFCIWKIIDKKMKSITFDYKNRGIRQNRDPYYLENGSIYIFKPQIIKQFNNRLGGKIEIFLMPFWKSYQIDSLEDIEICEFYMKNKILKHSDRKLILKNIKLVVYDFDGVFTDNKVILRENGKESVVVNRLDGLAIGILKQKGIKQIIITTETNKVVEERAKKLNIPVIYGVKNKKKVLEKYCKDNNIKLGNVIYVGDDLNDLEVMKIVGYPICPLNACYEIKNISKIILNAAGGTGVVRELLNILH